MGSTVTTLKSSNSSSEKTDGWSKSRTERGARAGIGVCVCARVPVRVYVFICFLLYENNSWKSIRRYHMAVRARRVQGVRERRRYCGKRERDCVCVRVCACVSVIVK